MGIFIQISEMHRVFRAGDLSIDIGNQRTLDLITVVETGIGF